MTRPRLSVIVPVRDRQAPLDRLLAELAAEAADRPGALEIVIVDDASLPPYAPPAGFAAGFPGRFVLLRRETRGGANAARRLGLEAATGDWAHFHDSDDGLRPGWLGAVLAAIGRDPAADLLVTRRLDCVGGRLEPRRQAYFERQSRRPDRIRRALRFRNVLGPFGGVLFRRAALAGVAFPDRASSQDWAVYRAFYEGPRRAAPRTAPRAALAPGALFVYRRDGADRISASARRKALGMFGLLRDLRGSPWAPLIRLHHLHYFRAHLAALGRPSVDRLLARTRLSRPLAHALALAYMALLLGWR